MNKPYPPALSRLTWGLVWLALAVSYCVAVEIAHAEDGVASWYSTEACRYNPDPTCPTASGISLYELEAKHIPFAAMWNVPLGSKVLVCKTGTITCTQVTILDRGPHRRLHRLIDLDKKTFRLLSGNQLERGTMPVTVTLLPSKKQATRP